MRSRLFVFWETKLIIRQEWSHRPPSKEPDHSHEVGILYNSLDALLHAGKTLTLVSPSASMFDLQHSDQNFGLPEQHQVKRHCLGRYIKYLIGLMCISKKNYFFLICIYLLKIFKNRVKSKPVGLDTYTRYEL